MLPGLADGVVGGGRLRAGLRRARPLSVPVSVIQMPPTKRPGASRWSGSNWSLTRRIRSSAGIGPHTSSACLDGGGRVDDDGAAAVPRAGPAQPRRARRATVLDRGAGGDGGVRDADAGRAAHGGPARACRGEHVVEAGEHEGQLRARWPGRRRRPTRPRGTSPRPPARCRTRSAFGSEQPAHDLGAGRHAVGAALHQHADGAGLWSGRRPRPRRGRPASARPTARSLECPGGSVDRYGDPAVGRRRGCSRKWLGDHREVPEDR